MIQNLKLSNDLVWKLVLPIIALIVVAVGVNSFYLPRTMRDGAIESALGSNVQVAEQIKIIRGYYTRNVVTKVKQSGHLFPSFRHKDDPLAIPLPATFVQDISELLKEKNTSLKLVSPYPWPHRAARKMDEFQTRAWQAFQKNPEMTISQEEVRNGHRFLRVAVSDRMAEACVTCHNADKLSPKNNWKVGDVRAVMEVTSLVEPYLASADKRSRYMVVAGQVAALAGIAVLVLVAFAISRRTREKNQAVERLGFLAHHDEMTGTLKRNRLLEMIRSHQARQGAHGSLALHFVDLDRFKEVNDNYGHAIGDALIRVAAERLRAVISPADLIARVGGDEFVVAQIGYASDGGVRAMGQALVDSMTAPFCLDGHDISISASVGSAIANDRWATVEDLLQRADMALYKAKSNGRNECRIFDPAIQKLIEERHEIEVLLRRALDTNGLELHFQPIYDAQSRIVTGFEALLRLSDGKGGRVSPAVFVPLAEELGLIGDIGTWVIQEACRFVSTLPGQLYVAVNLSPAQFTPSSGVGRGISDVVRSALAANNLAPERIELEITENLFLKRTDLVVRELRALAELGVSLAMDDFGTGYSSLSYLWDLPLNKIKIDRSFVVAWSAGEAPVAQILRTIISLCATLGFTITVEGVETEEQAAFFTENGCQYLQGFLFSAAIPPADIISQDLDRLMAPVKPVIRKRERVA